jgi:hypothetical protein
MIASSVGSPPPTANVVSVAELVAQPGQKFGMTAPRMNSAPHGFHDRAKPTIAVSPVASV